MDAKKLVIVVVVVFLGFWMFTDPSGLANLTKDGAAVGWDITADLFSATIDFIKQLF